MFFSPFGGFTFKGECGLWKNRMKKKHIFNDIKWKSGVRGGEESESEKQSTIIRGEKWK